MRGPWLMKNSGGGGGGGGDDGEPVAADAPTAGVNVWNRNELGWPTSYVFLSVCVFVVCWHAEAVSCSSQLVPLKRCSSRPTYATRVKSRRPRTQCHHFRSTRNHPGDDRAVITLTGCSGLVQTRTSLHPVSSLPVPSALIVQSRKQLAAGCLGYRKGTALAGLLFVT